MAHILKPGKTDNARKSHLGKSFLSDSLPQMMQKDTFCFSNISLCSFLTGEGFDCKDMIHCTVATLSPLNGDILLPYRFTEVKRLQPDVACALHDHSFITPTCTSMGINSKAREHRSILREVLVSHGGFVHRE